MMLCVCACESVWDIRWKVIDRLENPVRFTASLRNQKEQTDADVIFCIQSVNMSRLPPTFSASSAKHYIVIHITGHCKIVLLHILHELTRQLNHHSWKHCHRKGTHKSSNSSILTLTFSAWRWVCKGLYHSERTITAFFAHPLMYFSLNRGFRVILSEKSVTTQSSSVSSLCEQLCDVWILKRTAV